MLQALVHVLWGIAPLYVTMLLTVYLKRKNILKEELSAMLRPLFFKVSAPALIVLILSSVAVTSQTALLIVWGIALFGLYAAIAVITQRVMGGSIMSQRAAGMALTSFAVGTVAYPLIQSVFSSEVFSRVIIIDLTLLVMFMATAPLWAEKGSSNVKGIVTLLTTDPILLSVYIGLALSIFRVTLPIEIVKILNLPAQAFSFLGAVMLGLSVTVPSQEQIRQVGKLVLIKIVPWIVLWAVLRIFVPLDTLRAIILCISAPVGVMPLVYAEELKLDKQLVAQGIVVNTFIMVILYPLLILFLR